YGYLTALAFSAGPLGLVHDMPVQALFRGVIDASAARVRPRYWILTLAAALCIVAAVLSFAADKNLALIYMGVTVAAYFILRAAAFLIVLGARKAPHAKNVALRLAIGNIHRPGALTPSVVLSLGLGLALLVALTLIEGNIRAGLDETTPRAIPIFFFVDVQTADADRFTSFLKIREPEAAIELAPMLRGRIIRLKDRPVETVHAKQNAAWVLEGDRGITFSDNVPEGSELISGEWWPKNYQGPPLVSIDGEIADGLGLAIGDELTVNVLGRELTAKVANRRRVNWRSFGINFVMVFSPNSLAGAPHSNIATLTATDGLDPAREAALVRETAQNFPAVSIIRVKEALDEVNQFAGELALAVRGASSVAFLAAILVLGGALAAGQHARIHDAAVLKTLGATRFRLLEAYLYEYALIGLGTALFGIAAGSAAAYGIVRRVMELDFIWQGGQVFVAAGAAVFVMIILGLIGTYRVLGRKPASYLRDL
ncbi:MAG: FtsX-like permease family protein, partial [Alphaproteobacteria bacterium]|nr:FtsX-like permease family protein [Alphaproteobacteria bacterium]